MKLNTHHVSQIIRLYPNGVIQLKDPIVAGKGIYSFIQVIYSDNYSFRFRKNDYVIVSCEPSRKCCQINYYYGHPNNTITKVTKGWYVINKMGVHTFKNSESISDPLPCCTIKKYIPSNGYLH